MPKMPKINTNFQNKKSPACRKAGLLRLVAGVRPLCYLQKPD
jgi:hypothetical protein